MKRGSGIRKFLWGIGAIAVIAALVTGSLLYIHRGPAPITHVRIIGVVMGDSLAGHKTGHIGLIAMSAEVTCNTVSVATLATGAFSLVAPVAKAYDCQAASPLYIAKSITLTDSKKVPLTLNFDNPESFAGCTAQQVSEDCPALQLRAGTISGEVTRHGRPLIGVGVTCNDANSTFSSTTVTNASGIFTASNVFVDPYFCSTTLNDGNGAAQSIFVMPAATETVNLRICQRACPKVLNGGGQVMHTFTAYLIFWLPKGYVLEPGVSNSHYESVIAQYFRDVGDSRFYGLLSQYWDENGLIQNSVSLGGEYTDTRPYEHCATACRHSAASYGDPLLTTDIEAEITRVMQAKNWTPDPNSEFFVFTGNGAQLCGLNASSDCSFPIDNYEVCGAHDYYYSTNSAPVIYAQIADSLTAYYCTQNIEKGSSPPFGDWALDAEISTVAHEQFESATDPLINAWQDSSGNEIGDLCTTIYSLVPLSHGHTYLIQAMWSDSAGACAF